MSTVTPIITELPNSGEGEAYQIVWAAMANNDVGAPVKFYGYNERSVQVEGTFGSATVTVQGSLELPPINYESLRDPSSTALTFAAAAVKGVLEMVINLRPSVAGGGGTTVLTVTLVVARTKR